VSETPADYNRARRTYLIGLGFDNRDTANTAELKSSEIVLGALWYLNTRECAWLNKADDLKDFAERGHGWPKQGQNIPTSERSLFSWRIMQRKNRLTLSAVRLRYLNATVPGWDDVHRPPSFGERLNDSVAFVASHQRMPSATAHNAAERTLAAWLAAQRASYRVSRDSNARSSLAFGIFDPQQAIQLNEALPGWLTSESKHDAEWRRKAGELVKFVHDEKRWPTASRAAIEQEMTLYRWYGMQRRAASGGTGHVNFGSERRNFLDENLPGWNAKDPLAL
jgi:hypothetical protein